VRSERLSKGLYAAIYRRITTFFWRSLQHGLVKAKGPIEGNRFLGQRRKDRILNQ
jgi:hypothetical protein